MISDTDALAFQTTYENFRYRADGRPNAYDRGCMNNFLEVFYTKVPPSKHKFREPIQEEVRAPPANRAVEREEEPVGARTKVEDDLDIGGDLLKISQRHNYDGIDIEMGGGDRNGRNEAVSNSKLISKTDAQAPTVEDEVQHPSRGERSRSSDLASEGITTSAPVSQPAFPFRREAL